MENKYSKLLASIVTFGLLFSATPSRGADIICGKFKIDGGVVSEVKERESTGSSATTCSTPIIVGDEAFWTSRPTNFNSVKGWSDELWVKNLKNQKEELLLKYQNIVFRVSPDGKFIAYTNEKSIFLRERSKTSDTEIAPSYEDGYTLISWSKDGKRLWFGEGVIEGWGRLALYENGKLTWFPYGETSLESAALNPNLGWLATSNAPSLLESESYEKWMKTGEITHLEVIDLIASKKFKVAKVKSNFFSPKWLSDNSLEYEIDSVSHQMSEAEIRKHLTSQPSKALKKDK